MASVDEILWHTESRTSNTTSQQLPNAMVSEEIDSFLSELYEKGVLCPLMAMREPFSSSFVEKNRRIYS